MKGSVNTPGAALNTPLRIIEARVAAVEQGLTSVEEGVTSESGSVTLTNSEKYPFNNSIQTIPLVTERSDAQYIVATEVMSANGNVGEIEVSDVLANGFKLAFTGSAASVTIKYKIIGGYSK